MKIKIACTMVLLLPVLALADQPVDPRDARFYREELLNSRQGMELSGYTPIQILERRLENLFRYREDKIAAAFGKWSSSGTIADFPWGEATHFGHRWKTAGYTDIPDMLVNEDGFASSFNQRNPSACMFPDSSYVVVWEDERNGDMDIFGQKYSFEGIAQGLNLELGEEDYPKDQYLPNVTLITDTSFAMTWIDEENFDIYGKIFAADLSGLGDVFQINDSPFPYTTWSPAVSSGLDGRFVAAWEDTRENSHIYARRFDVSGNPLGPSFKVDDDQPSMYRTSPQVSVGPTGDFVIVWEDFYMGSDIYAQRFDSDGAKLGDNVLVNLDSLSEDQYAPGVSMGRDNHRFMVTWVDLRRQYEAVFARSLSFENPLEDTLLLWVSTEMISVAQETPQIVSDTLGRFTVSWDEYAPTAPTIYVQRFDTLGNASGSVISVEDPPNAAERHGVALSGRPDGSLVSAWMDKRAGNYDIRARTVNSLGVPQGAGSSILNDDLMGASQGSPRIAVRSDGGFIVVWEDMRRGSSDIFMKRFDQDAQPQGGDHMVNDGTGRVYRGNPDVACGSLGDFVVVWEDTRGGSLDIYAQLFDDSGSPNGENVRVNCSGMIATSSPRCEMSREGGFLVVWSSTTGGPMDIYARLFSSDGLPLDTCFRVNDDAALVNNLSPAVAADSAGKFVVTWHDSREGEDRVYLQRLASGGAKIGTNFAVHSDRPSPVQYNADLDVNQIGEFAVTWTEPGPFSNILYAQRYDSSGTPTDTNIMVVDDPAASPSNSKVRLTDDGYLVIVWTDRRQAGSDIYSQVFLHGIPQDVNQRINTDQGDALQDSPHIGTWNSHLLAVWRDNRIPGLGFSVFFNRTDYTETAVEEDVESETLPAAFGLHQNYPNPFNPTTTIQYFISPNSRRASARVSLAVYNVLGQRVRTLVDVEKQVGEFEIIWDGRDDDWRELPSGVYFCRLKVGGQIDSSKLLLLK